MRYYELSALVLCIISFNILTYLVGLSKGVITFVTFSALYAASLAITSVIIYKDIRKGLAATYLFLALVFIYAYGTAPNLVFKSALGPYMMFITPIVSGLAASILALRSDLGISLAQVLIIISLPSAFLDFGGLLPFALMTPHILLLKTATDGLRFAGIALLVYLPYLLIPVSVSDVSAVPHMKLSNVLYVSGGELNLLITMLIACLVYVIFNTVYHKFLRHYLPEMTEPRHLLPYSSVSYGMSLAVLTLIHVITGLVTVAKPVESYLSVIYASIPSFFVSMLSCSWNLNRELVRLSDDLVRNIHSLRDELNACSSVLNELIVDPLLGVKVSAFQDKLRELERELDHVEERVGKPTPSLNWVKGYAALLEKVGKELVDTRHQVVDAYQSIVKEVRESYDKWVSISGLRNAELDDLVKLLESIKRFEDIPSVGVGLRKALKIICESYIKTLNDLARIIAEVLAVRVSVDTSMQCPENILLLDITKAYADVLENLLSSHEVTSKASAIVERATRLKDSIGGVIEEFTHKVRGELLELLKEVSTNLGSFPQGGILTFKHLNDMKIRCSALGDCLIRLSDLILQELNIKEKLLISVADNLGLDYRILTPVSPSVMSKSSKDFTVFRNLPTCYDLIDWMSSKWLGLLYEHLFYLEIFDKTLRYTNYLQLFIKYFDERLKYGSLSLDDIPLSKEALKWFINVYTAIRNDVVVEGNVLKKVKG